MKHARILSLTTALAFVAGFATLSFAVPAAGPAPKSFAEKVLLGFGDESPQQKMPKVHPINNDNLFAAKKKTFNIVPFGENELEFNIDLPADWTPETLGQDANSQGLSQKILGDVARFKSPIMGTHTATLTVQVMYPEHEILAEHWLKNYILSNGYTPASEITAKGERRASAYFVSTNDMQSIYTYVVVQINAGTIMLARFDVPLALKDYVAFLQKKSVDSFQMAYAKEDPIERQKTFTMADAVKYEFPDSWQVSPASYKDMNRISMRLDNKNVSGILDGVISVTAIRRTRSTSLMSEIESFKKSFREMLNYDLVRLVSSDTSPAYSRFYFNRYEIYDIQARNKQQNLQELHFVLLGDKDWYLMMFMITPKERDNLYTWARNVRSYDLLIRSIK